MLRIVEESCAGPRIVAATARRHEIFRALLMGWRREARETAASEAKVMVL